MPRKSSIHKVDDNTFITAVKENFSIRAVLAAVGMNGSGNAYSVFKRRVEKLGLDTSHFTGKGHLAGKTHTWALAEPLDEILVDNSIKTITSKVKNRIVKAGLLTLHCYECGLKDTWNGKPITLQLDHIDGDNSNHRINNLRLLCPNCHSQTHTFAGRNK